MHNAPHALVDHERGLSAHTSVVVRLQYNSRRSVKHIEVEDLVLHDKSVEAVQHFLNRGNVAPPMHVHDIDVVGAELLKRVLNGVVHGLEIVAYEGTVLTGSSAFVVSVLLCGD